MGSNKFQRDYIEYLEESNTNLHNELVRVKNFQSRLLNKELRGIYHDTTLKEITNVCVSTCEAIDNLFENVTTTMNSLKNVLMWKSQIAQIPEKFSCMLDPVKDISSTVSAETDGERQMLKDLPERKAGKKCGTAKVSPMVKGHVISAPRILLNRVSENFRLRTNRALTNSLSPILERSPGSVEDVNQRPMIRDVRIPLRRLQNSNLAGRTSFSDGSFNVNRSPKFNFLRKPGSFRLEGQYTSLTKSDPCRCANEKFPNNAVESESKENTDGEPGANEKTENCNEEIEENVAESGLANSDEIDPLEGPSWLLDRQQSTTQPQSSSGLQSLRYSFINFKRPKYRSFTSVLKDNDRRDIFKLNGVERGSYELKMNNEENELNEKNHGNQDNEEEVNINEEISSDRSSSSGNQAQPEEIKESDDSKRFKSTSPIVAPISSIRSAGRKSDHLLTSGERKLRKSKGEGIKENSTNKIGIEKKIAMQTTCTVNLDRSFCNNLFETDTITPKRRKASYRTSSSGDKKSVTDSPRVGHDTGFYVCARGSGICHTPQLGAIRPKRRAALACIKNKSWVEITTKMDRDFKQSQNKKDRKKKKRSE